MAAPTVARGGAALAAIGATLLAILASLSPSAAVAAFPGNNGRIAYAGDPEGTDFEIFTILPDGSGSEQLTDNSAHDATPSWSPDGQSIVFTRVGPPSQVFKMDADGGGQSRLATSPATLASPSFSPSGRRIVYTKFDAIVTIRADGADRRRLVTGGALASPQYSPNGRRIAFGGFPEGEKRQGIWTIRRDGSRLRRLTNPEKLEPLSCDGGPDYSPDGRYIVFVHTSYCGPGRPEGNEIRLMRADGSRERTIPETGGFGSPAFAPAGDRIVVSVGQGNYLSGECSDLYTISPSGSDKQQITRNCDPPLEPGDGRFASSPSWQPVPAVK